MGNEQLVEPFVPQESSGEEGARGNGSVEGSRPVVLYRVITDEHYIVLQYMHNRGLRSVICLLYILTV